MLVTTNKYCISEVLVYRYLTISTNCYYRLGKSPSMGGDGDSNPPCGDLEGDSILSVCKAYHVSDIDIDRHHVIQIGEICGHFHTRHL